MIDNIMNIIRMLNDGNIISKQEDKKTRIDLHDDRVQLYIDDCGLEKKYYYFAQLEIGENKEDNLHEIENIVLENEAYATIGKPKPSDSYMILFWKIDNINESLYPYIIKIEENEFFYKKYVFYYTEKEEKCFLEWCRSLKGIEKPMLKMVLEEIQDLSDKSDQVQFLTRLLSKVPFLDPVFPKAEMRDFDKMVNKKIQGIRKEKENVEMINNMFTKFIKEENFDVEIFSDMIYKKVMEEN